MLSKKKDFILCVSFCLAVCAFFVIYLFRPQSEFSEKEKRYLQTFAQPSWEDIYSGQFGRDTEKAAADQLPGRDFFLQLYASFEKAINLQAAKDIYVGKSGRLYERPYNPEAAAMSTNMETINKFAESLGQEVDFMLIPSAGAVLEDDIPAGHAPYMDAENIDNIYSMACEQLRPIDIASYFSTLSERDKLYYRTDHHWTSLGAYMACSRYLESRGRVPLPEAAYDVENIPGFHGTAYSRACFWDIPSESLELWDDNNTYKVSFSDKEGEYGSLFFRDRLSQLDKYPVWLDGNHPLVTIENTDPEAEGSLLIVRDSFASCFACFAAGSYEKITLVDLRYYKLPVSQLCREESFDDILVMYYIGNFCTDSNIVWLS